MCTVFPLEHVRLLLGVRAPGDDIGLVKVAGCVGVSLPYTRTHFFVGHTTTCPPLMTGVTLSAGCRLCVDIWGGVGGRGAAAKA